MRDLVGSGRSHSAEQREEFSPGFLIGSGCVLKSIVWQGVTTKQLTIWFGGGGTAQRESMCSV